MYVTAILEFSEDDLTVPNASATWTAVTNVLLEAEWSGGVQKEGDDPTPGSARFLFHDNTRQFEPDFAAGAFYPNVVPGRRFRLRITSSAVTYDEGIWYSQVFEPSWPDGATGQRSQVACGDGMTILALDDLPGLDPPEADTYADAVAFDEPWGYWRLGDPPGTQAVANFRRVLKGKGKNRRKVKVRRGTRYITAGETGATAGPAGIYKTVSLVTLGEEGVILGDRDTSAKFDTSAGAEGRVAIPIEDTDSMTTTDGLSVECWFKVETTSLRYLVTAARNNALGQAWVMAVQTNDLSFDVRVSPSTDIHCEATSVISLDTWHHAAATYDAGTINLYLDGVLVATASGAAGPLVVPTAGNSMFIAFSEDANQGFDGWIDEVAVYEHALGPERVLAHYQAGAERGYPQQTAGERIAAIATSDLWDETGIQTTGRDVLPIMQHGQPRLEEITETAHAEGPRTMFFFDGTGDPVYLGHEWQATHPSYYTPQATFGNTAGEVPFENVELVSDDETFNEVLASHESGEAVTVSTGEDPRRVNSEWTDVLLVEHNEVESLANHVLDFYSAAQFRPYQLELSGVDTSARAQILIRQPGDCIRVKHRPRGTGAIIDRVCNIIGYEKRLDAETGHLSCTWYLSRGFNAGTSDWQAGVVGFSEAGVTTTTAAT